MNLYWVLDTFLDEAANRLSNTILSEATGIDFLVKEKLKLNICR